MRRGRRAARVRPRKRVIEVNITPSSPPDEVREGEGRERAARQRRGASQVGPCGEGVARCELARERSEHQPSSPPAKRRGRGQGEGQVPGAAWKATAPAPQPPLPTSPRKAAGGRPSAKERMVEGARVWAETRARGGGTTRGSSSRGACSPSLAEGACSSNRHCPRADGAFS